MGFDPGSTRSGYGVIGAGGTAAQPTFSFLGCGDVESSGPALDAFFARCEPFQVAAGKTVAVEVTQGRIYGDKGAGIAPDLLACARADALICENVRWRGVDLVTLPAVRWRKAVAGNGHASDRILKIAIGRLLRGMPARTNVHNRDGLGVAIAAAMGMRQ